jgi:hypothetical protein
MASPPSLLARFSHCLKRADWSHTTDPEKRLIFLVATDSVAALRCNFIVKESQAVILLISLERRCPSAYFRTMETLCNLANHDIAFGFFSVDTRDGEVRFRHSVDLAGIEITPVFVSNFLKPALTAVRKHYEAVQAIMDGFSLEAAVKRIKS